MSLPTVNGVGTLVADPELRFTPGGAAVATVNIAFNNRYKDSKSGEWVDGDATFLRGQVWNQYAENVVDSLKKGTQVSVTGALKQRKWQDREGNERTSFELDIFEIGPTLRFATAAVEKKNGKATESSGGSGW